MSSALHQRRALTIVIAILLVTTAIPTGAAVGPTAAPPVDDEAATSSSAVTEDANSTASVEGLRTWVAPKAAELTTLRDLQTAKASGNLTRNRVVSERDTLVFELRGSGLEDVIADQPGPNATARFFAAFDGTVGNVTVRHLHPGASQAPAVLDLRNHTATTVVPDPGNETYYVVVDLPDASMDGLNGDELHWSELRSGEYRATIELAATSALAGPNESVATELSVRVPTAHFDAPHGTRRVFVAPAADQTVAGTTPVAPGTDLTVRIYDDLGNRLDSETVTVQNGTGEQNYFAATFDFADFSPGQNVTVTVELAGGRMLLGSRTGQEGTRGVVEPLDASVNLTRRGLTDSGVVVENAILSHGGYVAVHHDSADGEVLARSEAIAPGETYGRFLELDVALESNTTLVVVAHRAGPGDSLGEPYTENGSVVADSVEFVAPPVTGTVTVTTRNPTETTVPSTADETTTPITVDTTTRMFVDTTTESEGTVAGFGVGTTLVALLAGGLVARRTKRKEKRR